MNINLLESQDLKNCSKREILFREQLFWTIYSDTRLMGVIKENKKANPKLYSYIMNEGDFIEIFNEEELNKYKDLFEIPEHLQAIFLKNLNKTIDDGLVKGKFIGLYITYTDYYYISKSEKGAKDLISCAGKVTFN